MVQLCNHQMTKCFGRQFIDINEGCRRSISEPPLVECLHKFPRPIARIVDGPRVIGMEVETLASREKSIVHMELNITMYVLHNCK